MTAVLVISATVVTDDPQKAAKAAEVLARAATGLILEGINVAVTMAIPQDEDEEVLGPSE